MRPLKMLLIALAVGLLPSFALAADATSALTDAQKSAVEAVVRELLTKKEPELIVKAAQIVQEKMEKETAEKGQEAVKKNKQKLTADADTPIGGNPKGDVTVVEFFDYSCGYCKMAQVFVEKFLSEDKNVRFVYKELPILGPGSIEAAKVALASANQGKYVAFHNAMMESKEHPSLEVALKIAKGVGLDVEKLKKDMESDKIKKMIDANRELADSMGARGTPTFIIGENLYPGALPLDQLKKAVSDVRAAAAKK